MTKKGSNNGGGARNKWDELEMNLKIPLVQGWARDGLTVDEICKNLGIARQTFYKWKKEHEVFADAVNRSREIINRHVENALYQSALGREVWEETKELRPVVIKGDIQYDEEGKVIMEMVTVEMKKKYIPANTTAQIFFLKNRMRDIWSDKQDINHTGEVSVMFKDDLE